jgi:protocatechuate 3,4-dioxygenase beta subunit
MKRHYLKILSIFVLCLGILASCGGGGAGSSSSSVSSGSSLVSLSVGGSGQTASLKIEKNTLFVQAKKWFNDLINTDEVIAGIPSNVSTITFTISAPDLTTITKTDLVSGQSSITETFTVSNGNSRHFAIYASDSNGAVLYTGSSDADLNGSAVTLNISMVATAAVTYTISGTVTDATGKALSGATVTLTGATAGTSAAISSKSASGNLPIIMASTGSSTTTTDASGQYTFAGLASGTYSISVSLSGYSFSPSSSTVTVSNSNITGQNFTGTATPSTHSISGKVTASTTSTGALSGVTVILSGAGSGTTATDANGNYSFSGLQNGSYTIVPSLTGYTFSPAILSVNINGTDVTGQNFTATSTGCNSAGTIKIASITPAQGTVLTAGQNYTFNATVQYDFQSAAASSIGILVYDSNSHNVDNQTVHGSSVTTSSGTATVSATATMSYQGQPITSATVSVPLYAQGFSCTNVSDKVTYTVSPASTYTISGTITANGSGLAGVTVTLTGTGSASTTTDSSGHYSFASAANGTYTVTPSLAGYSFTPASASVTVNNANATQNFTASGITYTMSGSVTANGSGLAGVTVTLTGAATNSTTTNANGKYSFNVASGNYTITPSLAGYGFSPASATVSVNSANVTVPNFTAITSSGLVGYWSFNDSTNIGQDSSGYNNKGTATSGISYIAKGVSDGAANFVEGSAIIIPSSTSLNLSGAMTATAWVNLNGIDTDNGDTILSKSEVSTDEPYGFFARLDSSAEHMTLYSDGLGGNFDSGYAVPLNQWVHLAVTYDGLMVRFYANGALVNEQAATGSLGQNTSNLYVGQSPKGAQENFSGMMDEVRLYNRALSASEIQQIYGSSP